MNKKRMLLFLCGVALLNIGSNMAHPVTPAFIVERSLDSSMFGVALAAMMTMNFLFSPFWGRLCNYIPTRIIMFIGGIGYSIGQIIFLFAYNEAMVVAGRMFAGIFIGAMYTAISNYVINVAENGSQRDHNLTLMVTVQNVAGACGFFLGGMLGEITIETSIGAQVLVLACTGVFFRMVCLDDTPYKVEPSKALSLRDTNPFSAFISVRKYMTPMLTLIFIIVAISAIGQNSYEQCFNYFIKDQYGMTSAYNGIFKAFIALVTLILNSTVCVYLQKKTDINKTFLLILLACSALISIILIFNNQILFVAIYILYSSVNVIRMPLLQSIVARQSTSENGNSLMGFYQSMNSLGGIFGALFAGLIYAQGAMLPFILAFAAYLISSVVGVGYIRQYRKHQSV